MRWLITVSILLGSVISQAVYAQAAASCLQASIRSNACPHQIYRVMQLPDMPQSAVRCICVTDFAPLLAEANTPEQRLAQLRLKQQLEQDLQFDVTPILDILRRAR